MEMSNDQWLILGSYIIGIIVALLNFWEKIWKSKTSKKVEDSNVGLNQSNQMIALNKSIEMAYARASKAEADYVEAEKRFEEKELVFTEKLEAMEIRLNLFFQKNQKLESEIAELRIKQVTSDKIIEEQGRAQLVSQRLIEEQRREIIALQYFSERLIAQVISHNDTPVEYKPGE
jgi:hypothetical protein